MFEVTKQGLHSGMEQKRYCLCCGKELHGRPDKKFCSEQCKDKWNNARKCERRQVRTCVLRILECNYSILRNLTESGGTVWDLGLLAALGFRPDYITRLVSNKKGYLICECFDIRYHVTKTKLALESSGSALD